MSLSSWLAGIGGAVVAGIIVAKAQRGKRSDDFFERGAEAPENPNSLDGQAVMLNQTVAGRVPQLSVQQIRAKRGAARSSNVGKVL